MNRKTSNQSQTRNSTADDVRRTVCPVCGTPLKEPEKRQECDECGWTIENPTRAANSRCVVCKSQEIYSHTKDGGVCYEHTPERYRNTSHIMLDYMRAHPDEGVDAAREYAEKLKREVYEEKYGKRSTTRPPLKLPK